MITHKKLSITSNVIYLSRIAISSSSMSKSLTTSTDADGGSSTWANSSSRVPIIMIFMPGFKDSSLNIASSVDCLPKQTSYRCTGKSIQFVVWKRFSIQYMNTNNPVPGNSSGSCQITGTMQPWQWMKPTRCLQVKLSTKTPINKIYMTMIVKLFFKHL